MVSSKKKLLFEKVVQGRDCSFEVENHSAPVLDCAYHYHPEPELTLIVSGTGRLQIGSEWIPIEKGTLFWVGSGVPHIVIFQQDSVEHTETIVLKFPKIFTDNGMLLLPEFSRIQTLFAEPHRSMIWQSFQRTEELRRILRLEGMKKLLALFSLLDGLSLDNARILAGPQGTLAIPNRKQQEEIETTVAFMHKNFTKPLTICDVAAAVRMNPESFRRFFQQRVRINFTNFLLEMRLTHARKLLIETSDPIWEIAQKSGFATLSNFNRLFLKHCGISPRQYRKL